MRAAFGPPSSRTLSDMAHLHVRGSDMWCPRHGQLLTHATSFDEVVHVTMELVDQTVRQLGLTGDDDFQVLHALMPLCCYLGDDAVREAFARHVAMN